MTLVQVFDPAMCCSTGVCGPSVDPQLVRFAADLDWLKSQGVSVERFNLAQEPRAFAENAAVKDSLEVTGEAALPLVQVDGEVKSRGVYPSRDELALWAGVILWWPVTTTMREAGWLPNGWIRTVLVGISGTLGFSLALIHHRNSQQKQWRDSQGRAFGPPGATAGTVAADTDRLCACEQQITELKTAIAAAYHAAGLEPPEPPQRLRLVSGESPARDRRWRA